MTKAPTNLPASVRQRLLNLATEKQRDFGLVLTQYGLERLLYRLSVSRHRNALILKGALLLQTWTANVYRPTRDLDLLGVSEGSVEHYRKLFAELCSQRVEADGLSFLPETIRVERIRDQEEYEGVRVLMEARLANARIPLQIDVGFGDVITPGATEIEYPTLLPFPAPKLRAYPKESVVAEKFEAMVKLGVANSRMKDFYDLWVLARQFEFRGPLLARALRATFARRRTALPVSTPLAFTPEFAASPGKQKQWQAFLGKSGLEAEASLREVVGTLEEFVMPAVEASKGKKQIPYLWKAGGPWEKREL